MVGATVGVLPGAVRTDVIVVVSQASMVERVSARSASQ
jgi:hypothetical protein